MAWQTPKTNWVASESYNYSDINRVENNTLEVHTYLTGIGYALPGITTVTNRTSSSYDLISSINRLENNLDSIKNNFVTPPGWQAKQTWTATTSFDENHANRWENNVSLLYEYAQLTFQSYRYAGTFNAGQEVLG